MYAKAIRRPFRVIRRVVGRAALFGVKFIYTFVLLQFEFIRLYGAGLSMQKRKGGEGGAGESLAPCVAGVIKTYRWICMYSDHECGNMVTRAGARLVRAARNRRISIRKLAGAMISFRFHVTSFKGRGGRRGGRKRSPVIPRHVYTNRITWNYNVSRSPALPAVYRLICNEHQDSLLAREEFFSALEKRAFFYGVTNVCA